MIPIGGVYEVAIRVRDLKAAEAFYRDILGLQFGFRDERRNWLFLRAGESAGMVVLQEDHGEWPQQHFALMITDHELEPAAALLREKGVNVVGPVFHDWIPGRSAYFSDPDGHALELFAQSGSVKRGRHADQTADARISSSLTHFGLHVADVDETAAFYERFAGMRTIRTFDADESVGVKTKWLKSADESNPFVLVLLSGKSPPLPARPQHAIGPLSHFGIGLDSREAVDAVAERAKQAGILIMTPRYGGEVVGYHCYLRDPNGHSVEFSFGQALE